MRLGITRVDPVCWMRCCFLKPAKSRLTVSREVPIICPISSCVSASFIWLGFLASVFWSSHPTKQASKFFAGRVGKDQVADFTASGGIILG